MVKGASYFCSTVKINRQVGFNLIRKRLVIVKIRGTLKRMCLQSFTFSNIAPVSSWCILPTFMCIYRGLGLRPLDSQLRLGRSWNLKILNSRDRSRIFHFQHLGVVLLRRVCFLGEAAPFIIHSHFDNQDLKHFYFLHFQD